MSLFTLSFDNYLSKKRIIPRFVWWGLRIAALLASLALVRAISLEPQKWLAVFWFLLVPSLPLIFLVLPGLWRQICPFALANQLPRIFRFSLAMRLPSFLQRWSFFISIALLLSSVVLRQPFLAENPDYTSNLIAGMLACAFLGGFLFKGRAGWCGTFCPLSAVQRFFGHAPSVIIPNGYCPSCVGCQKNCYDFNPRPALLSDLSDPDARYATNRTALAAFLPGFLFEYFQNPEGYIAQGWDGWLLSLGFSGIVTSGIFYLLSAWVRVSIYKLLLIYIAATLGVFYYFTLPVMLETFGTHFPFLAERLLSPEIIEFLPWALVGAGGFVALIGLAQERVFRRQIASSAVVSVGSAFRAKRELQEAEGGISVFEEGSQTKIKISTEDTLLEAIERAGLPIGSGCRMGICGADPVSIVSGAENLNAIGETERDTLTRIGLAGRARLACVTHAQASMCFHLDPHYRKGLILEKAPDMGLSGPDPLEKKSIVIIGNGISGTSLAEALRRRSSNCKITLITRETYPLYNRIGINRMLSEDTSFESLILQDEDWHESNSIRLMLNTRVKSFDPEARIVYTSSREKLSFDYLVLATGARAITPSLEGNLLSGIFTIRSIDDITDIRAWKTKRRATRCVIVGGGILGIETALVLRSLGLSVVLICRTDRLCDRLLDETASNLLLDYLREKDIRVYLETEVQKFEGKRALSFVEIGEAKKIPADFCVLCTGISPESGLASTAGLETDNGIIVNRHMQSPSHPFIYAIGDCAQFSGPPLGLWGVSQATARIAAANIIGANPLAAISEKDLSIPYIFKTKGINIQSMGRIFPNSDERVLTRNSNSENKWWRLVVDPNGHVTGGCFVNNDSLARTIILAMARNIDISTIMPDIAEQKKNLQPAL